MTVAFEASDFALLAAVIVGGALQRIAGMGFAMVVAPFAVLLLSGQQGVVFANLSGAFAAMALIWPARADIDRKRLLILSTTSIAGAAGGALIVRFLDIGTFRILVGGILLCAILGSLLIARSRLVVPLTPASFAAGSATGLLVTMSGIGGPPMSIYAVLTRWEHRQFAATMQPFVLFSSLIAAGAVLLSVPDSAPQLPPANWLIIAGALVSGLAIGQLLHRRIPPTIGRIAVIVLGIIGAVTAIVSGVSIVVAGRG
ncbi:sulfite exporter TauE/SafE family protein [Microbacterium sp. LMC-P-041]|uniref:sulfite exporter TauE/SafE family protein n=1 Tax=Microbacterium sp. LMC-P-041 TaxID=3040293 RepID=UPI0025521AD6|nr:sulfite exporter TauE/SafE family protein [Microbacterium sp. LMC-P-041]